MPISFITYIWKIQYLFFLLLADGNQTNEKLMVRLQHLCDEVLTIPCFRCNVTFQCLCIGLGNLKKEHKGKPKIQFSVETAHAAGGKSSTYGSPIWVILSPLAMHEHRNIIMTPKRTRPILHYFIFLLKHLNEDISIKTHCGSHPFIAHT